MTTYSQPPPSATLALKPFQLKADESVLRDLKVLLKHARLPIDTFENTREDKRYGLTKTWIEEAKAYWETSFDWRKHEAKINSFPQFTAPVQDGDGTTYNIHFVALFSSKANAVPLLFLHGWPGSFLEFLPILDLLRNKYTPETLPYHVVVPSLPGFPLSPLPVLERDFEAEDVARIFDHLAQGLFGDTPYVVQGGDIGSRISRILGGKYPRCKAVHLNFCLMSEPKGFDASSLTEREKASIKQGAEFRALGSAYAITHATRPATIGIVLSSSPVALLAWIGEKFLAWTDEKPSLDAILESITLYWITNTISSSLYTYRQAFIAGRVSHHDNPEYYINKPLGYSSFPKELGNVPKGWIETTGKLVFYKQHEKGGHFAAFEQPRELLEDVEAFVKGLDV